MIDAVGPFIDWAAPGLSVLAIVTFTIKLLFYVQERTSSAHARADAVNVAALERAKQDLQEFREEARKDREIDRAHIVRLEERLKLMRKERVEEMKAAQVERAQFEARIAQLEQLVAFHAPDVADPDAPTG